MIRDKRDHCIMVTGSIQQRDVKLLSLCILNAASAKSLQSCPTLCDPIDGSPPGSPVPGILQAGTLKWVAMSSSNESESESEVAQPTRLLHPWDFPGKSTEVGCHCLLCSCLYCVLNHLHFSLICLFKGQVFFFIFINHLIQYLANSSAK